MKRIDASTEAIWIALSLSPHIGAKTFQRLRRHFDDDLAAVLAASAPELQRVHGIGPAIAREIQAIDLERSARQIVNWRELGVACLRLGEGAYPTRLGALEAAPPLVFARGELDADLWARTIAIVGARQPSQEALTLARQLAEKLARHGYTVASGLALGIDKAAHCGALNAGGKTIAVLGSGVLNVYPAVNRELAGRIQAQGALLSELNPGWGVNAQRLVARNRLISGLSQAVVLVESGLDGGAMYTARFAREQGRHIATYDLPASGNQALLRQGALAIDRGDPLGFLARLDEADQFGRNKLEHLTHKQMFVYNGGEAERRHGIRREKET